jgi:hypothetical protein
MRRPAPGLRECFAFPISTPEGRRDVLLGGTLLLLPLLGWILNLGHRLDVVYRVYHDEPPYFRGFAPWGHTLRRGLRAFAAITVYLMPAILLAGATAALHCHARSALIWVTGPLALACFLAAIYALPGGMTYNAAFNDLSYLYRPDKALRRALDGGSSYLHAWAIAIAAMALTPLGLLAVGVGFFYSSVWGWSVVGYAFSRALVLNESSPVRPPPP